jgi:hypothetical protein
MNVLITLVLFVLAAVNFYFGVTGLISPEGPEVIDFINLVIGLLAIIIGIRFLFAD